MHHDQNTTPATLAASVRARLTLQLLETGHPNPATALAQAEAILAGFGSAPHIEATPDGRHYISASTSNIVLLTKLS